MTPQGLAALVRLWVRWYTRGLPAAVAERRRDEIAADLWDHVEHARSAGTHDRQITRAVASRWLRGMAADASWRRGQQRLASRAENSMWVRRVLARPAARVALGVGLVLALPAVATARGAAEWSAGDFVLAGVLLSVIGLTLEFALRSAGNVYGAATIAALGVAAAVVGEDDDAPGLVLIGLVLVVSAGLLVARITRRAR